MKPQVCGRREIIKIREEINEMEKKKDNTEKPMKLQTSSSEKSVRLTNFFLKSQIVNILGFARQQAK